MRRQLQARFLSLALICHVRLRPLCMQMEAALQVQHAHDAADDATEQRRLALAAEQRRLQLEQARVAEEQRRLTIVNLASDSDTGSSSGASTIDLTVPNTPLPAPYSPVSQAATATPSAAYSPATLALFGTLQAASLVLIVACSWRVFLVCYADAGTPQDPTPPRASHEAGRTGRVRQTARMSSGGRRSPVPLARRPAAAGSGSGVIMVPLRVTLEVDEQ
jgi:hypothetical protein